MGRRGVECGGGNVIGSVDLRSFLWFCLPLLPSGKFRPGRERSGSIEFLAGRTRLGF